MVGICKHCLILGSQVIFFNFYKWSVRLYGHCTSSELILVTLPIQLRWPIQNIPTTRMVTVSGIVFLYPLCILYITQEFFVKYLGIFRV